MKIHGIHHQSLRFDPDSGFLHILDQTRLPFRVEWLELRSLIDIGNAISTMQVRGAPAIGAVAAYGVVMAVKEQKDLHQAAAQLKATRPTAVNLAWAVDRMLSHLSGIHLDHQYHHACLEAARIADEDVAACSAIGDYGLGVIERVIRDKDIHNRTFHILTHCNAGWLATVDWGTALAPIYKAWESGLNIHVWVDETRPRNQGALLTAFELREQGIPHTLICDNTGGHLMQHGKVDLCLVGSDRTTANGDVCNKIGTYLKALAAHDNHVPFYVALPVSTIDWTIASGSAIPIEERDPDEVLFVNGLDAEGNPGSLLVTLPDTAAMNPAFDVTPARLVSGLITEKGVFPTTQEGMRRLHEEVRNG